MKRGHWGDGDGSSRDADDSAKRQRRRYDDRPRADARDKQRRQTSPFRGGGGAGRPSLAPPPSSGGHSSHPQVQLLSEQKETDAHRLAQRQKQIDYGKNTLGYDRYCALVPRHKRRPKDPVTPDKTALVGKKVFDRMVSKWRQALHKFDPPELAQQQEPQDSSSSSGDQQQQGSTEPVTTAQEAQDVSVAAVETKELDAAHADSADPAPSAASRSIFDNFDEADGEGDDDDDDDDLL